jgi:hypothetical protein
MSLERWTQSMGRTEGVTRSSRGVEIRSVSSSASCAGAFDDGANSTIEVEAPTEADAHCAGRVLRRG